MSQSSYQNMSLHSLELEKYLLAGLLRFPETFLEVEGLITELDFTNNLHKTIYSVIRQTLRQKEKIEPALIAEKINMLSLSFADKVSNVFDYLNDLKLIQIQYKGVMDIADELSKYTMCREVGNAGLKMYEVMQQTAKKLPREEIMQIADQMYNEKISIWDSRSLLPENLGSDIDALLNGDVSDPGYPMPYQYTQRLYGSLLRPGNISVICARSGAGKTTFLNDLCYKVSRDHNVPVIHFDNGEMLKEELQYRMLASLSGVPLYDIESRKYRSDKDCVERVDKAVKLIEARQFHYFDVAGKSVDEMVTLLRRFYLSKIGRGNPLIFSFDYIKSASEKNPANRQEYELIGSMVTKFKNFIKSEIPMPMITAVQANRNGVVTNRMSSAIIDDESIVSGGDRVIHYASHAFILRKKTHDELLAENKRWGTHKLINIKPRHLGQDVKRALALVKIPGQDFLKSNYINFDVDNFSFEEKGDLVLMAQALNKYDITTREVKKSVEI
jgi:replicative DNA helicase